MKLEPDDKLDVAALLEGIAEYRPRRKGWHWREQVPDQKLHKFVYKETSKGVKNSIPLPAAHYFGDIDPQPDCVVTTEIASGRFEDDIRRMRMAAWHGADHMMVIRTAGQSHMDGLLEGTPEGVGGIAVTRKQVRATRRALDLIEDEVGRPINFHSYVSGVAGPEIAVMFAEEGVNGAHQDPQYNVLYRNINMYRSFVDAAVAKYVMASVRMAQIDGAHNANATAVEAWNVMPELLVQHAINCAFSVSVGMPKEDICLSTVPPDAAPAPCMRMDLPYAVALRDFFGEYKMRAQENTRYMESDGRDATVSHVMNLLISRLTSADIQSTITPDEGRNVPWHYNNVAAVNTAKQSLVGMDGLREMVKLDRDAPELDQKVREIKERAVLFLEAMLREGGYFASVEEAYFVDSGIYPETHDDGIARKSEGGVAAGTIVPRAADYLAPVCHHFGENHLPEGLDKACDLIGGCTLCDAEKVPFIDELDPEDNVNVRLAQTAELRAKGLIKPEVQWAADGWVVVTMFLPAAPRVAEFAALEFGKAMNLQACEVINKQVMHPAEGTLIELKGRLDAVVDPATLTIPPEPGGDERRRDQGLRHREEAQVRGRHRGRRRALGGHARDHRHQARRSREMGLRLRVPGHLGAGREGPRRGHRARRPDRAHLDDHLARRHAPREHAEARRPGRGEGRARQAPAHQRRHPGHRRARPQLGHGRRLRARRQGHRRRLVRGDHDARTRDVT